MKVTRQRCAGCPADGLLDISAIKRTEEPRQQALDRIAGRPALILLAESRPANRFVYDPDSDYSHLGLRTYLRRELTGTDDDAALFSFLDRRRVWIADCALCPLYLLKTNKQKRHAATECLLRYTRAHLDQYPEVPIATVFPAHRGFLKLEVPDIQERVVRAFDFSDLSGLRRLVGAVS
jgi:hypothetical protein